MLERKENISTLLTSVLPGSTILDLRLIANVLYLLHYGESRTKGGGERDATRERTRDKNTQREHTGTRSEVL